MTPGPDFFPAMPHLREHGFETGYDEASVAGAAAVDRAPAESERCCPSRDERDGTDSSPCTVRAPLVRDED